MSTLRIPFIKSDRAAFGLLFGTGLVLCSAGGLREVTTRGWLHPITVLGSALGTLAVLLGVSVLFRIRIGPLQDDRAALKMLLCIIAIKIVASLFYGLF